LYVKGQEEGNKLYVRCPCCCKRHLHGNVGHGRRFEPRVAHCVMPRPPTYIIGLGL
jgi:hypothetical protein